MLTSPIRKIETKNLECLVPNHTVNWESTGVKSKAPREGGAFMIKGTALLLSW